MSDLNDKLVSGLKWGSVEKFSTYGVQFLLSIVMARLLTPADFGVVGMITIFLALSTIFIDSGFAVALIRKKDATDTDFSSVFYFNILLSLLFYGVLYLAAPAIASFYDTPILCRVTRILGLTVIISSLTIVQRARVTKEIRFNIHAKVTFTSAAISGTAGIAAAYAGFGPWAIVLQLMLASALTSALYWYFSSWRPSKLFSLRTIREMFSFSSKLLVATLLLVIYNNIYQLVIGKWFSMAQVGFFSKANSYANLPNDAIGRTINNVALPALARIGDNDAELLGYYRRLLRGTSCVLFPIMGAIVALAVPGVRLVLTEKWMPAAPLLQILATACVMAPIRMINQNVYHIKGRSDIYLKTEVINKLLITALLAATIPLGIQAICWGFLAVSYVQFFVNAHYNSRLVGYHLRRQLGDIGRPLLVTLVMTAAIFGLTLLIRHDLAAILAGGAVMLATSAWMLNREVRIRTLYAKFFHKA
ncbi:lipopolysaccharide biosynthesis protein [uncultured Alistipes sp.]|uniref:lipopolysaccharide biosynthesis protein n=1 Tax=Alistipes sp. TaxID=1872444 RepID=UPI00266BFF23|nr:lipopolysaccharide biosynthesis protein [uncultured Alistipes sp.]